MINAIKHTAFILCFTLMLGMIFSAPAYSIEDPSSTPADCAGAYNNPTPEAQAEPSTSNMFDDTILQKMSIFMVELHKTLSQPLMIGHSLMCYAADVAFICVGKLGICAFEIYHPNFFISGLIIYFVGILMAMSIGMYFVDISFKLGFAVLFMPISIALWPFPPTKNKFSENLSIIIRNGMLFALVSIGVCFAVTLIKSSLFDPANGISETKFWMAISAQDTELLTKNFALDDFHFLIVAFGLIFAFKILASSVNDYLDYFFSDSVFGSESPMHKMGTQAVGMVTANTIKPAASFIKDVAKTQTGRGIAKLGGGIAALATKDGRKELAGNIKKGYQTAKRVVTNPRASFNSAMTSVENTTKEAAASLVKGVGNTALLFLPTTDTYRKKKEKQFDEWADKNIAQGKLRNLAADTAAFGANTYNQLIRKKNAKFVTRDDVKETIEESLNSVKEDLSNLHGDKLKENVKTGIVKAATKINNEIQEYRDNPDGIMDEKEMRDALHKGKELGKTLANIAGDKAEKVGKSALASVYNQVHMMAGTGHALKNADNVVDAIKQDAQTLKEGVTNRLDKIAKSKLAKELVDAWKESDKAPVTLQPSAIISAPFKAIKGTAKGLHHPIDNMVENMNKLATGWEKLQAEKEKDSKIIWKKGGRLVLRTAARTIKGTGKETASVLGNALKNFGESLQQNGNRKQSGWTSWQEMHDAEERKKEAIQEDKDYFNSLSDKYDE